MSNEKQIFTNITEDRFRDLINRIYYLGEDFQTTFGVKSLSNSSFKNQLTSEDPPLGGSIIAPLPPPHNQEVTDVYL